MLSFSSIMAEIKKKNPSSLKHEWIGIEQVKKKKKKQVNFLKSHVNFFFFFYK